MLAGIRNSCAALAMISVARPSDTPGGRLNEIVTHGNWLWWLIDNAVLLVVNFATLASGTCWPVLDLT